MSQDDTRADVPPGVDPNTPSVARMYDFFLNGRHHYPVDEAAARAVLEKVPETYYLANANRVFLQRAAGRLAREYGIRQFIDIGAGLPTQWNTHEVVQVVDPGTRVVYVDNDPMVLAHSKDMLERAGETNVLYVDGDVTRPESILDNPEVRDVIDFDRPVGYMTVALWHFVSDEQDPRGLIRRYMDAVPSGSYLALSHLTEDGQRPERTERFKAVYNTPTPRLFMRPISEIEQLVDGLEFIPPYPGAEPGLSFIDAWGSKNPSAVDPAHTWGPCGVAGKS